jgi:hypothetical protein
MVATSRPAEGDCLAMKAKERGFIRDQDAYKRTAAFAPEGRFFSD